LEEEMSSKNNHKPKLREQIAQCREGHEQGIRFAPRPIKGQRGLNFDLQPEEKEERDEQNPV